MAKRLQTEKPCAICGEDMEWEDCDELSCDDGYDDDDILGLRRCSRCDGLGGWWFCQQCAANAAEQMADEDL